MKVKEVMTPNVETLQSNYTLLDASKKMRDLNVGAIPVNEDGSIVGILTDRDIVVRAISEELNPANTSVREVMSSKVLSCSDDADIEQAAKLMEEYKVRRLLVNDRTGKVVGICSLGDLAVHAQKELSGEVIKDVSEPSTPSRS
ncbi:MAG: CBS domain-containing protein [Chitinispirillaceae bacterium]